MSTEPKKLTVDIIGILAYNNEKSLANFSRSLNLYHDIVL